MHVDVTHVDVTRDACGRDAVGDAPDQQRDEKPEGLNTSRSRVTVGDGVWKQLDSCTSYITCVERVSQRMRHGW